MFRLVCDLAVNLEHLMGGLKVMQSYSHSNFKALLKNVDLCSPLGRVGISRSFQSERNKLKV